MLLHELVANGIGGRTVAEARARLTHREVAAWSAYRQRFGSLNVGLRLEVGFAQVLAMVAAAMGNKVDVYDFMPHVEKPKPPPMTFAQFAASLGAVAPARK